MEPMEQEKVITIESLAGKVDLLSDRVDALTQTVKDGFKKVDEELIEIRDDLRDRPTHADLRDELEKYRYAKDIDAVSKRVSVCERKLGIESPPDFELGLE